MKRSQWTVLSALSAVLSATGVANAQVADGSVEQINQAPQQEQDNRVVVTGIKGSLQSAAEQKRDASQVIDAITAEDIGKFPTENVAEAVQHVTGVQITRTRGEGTSASIRGLPSEFTRVELNGGTLASATVDLRGGGGGGDLNRSFDFRLLPAEFVRTLEVVKSPTANMQEGGLSGTINVVTARPLDLGKLTLVGSGFASQNSNSGKTDPQFSGLFSNVFMDGRLGVLLTAGYTKSRPETHSMYGTVWGTQSESVRHIDYNNDGDQTDTFNIPGQLRPEITREDNARTALAGVVEFDASDDLRLSAEGFYSKRDTVSQSFEYLHIPSNANGPVFDNSKTQFLDIAGIDPTQVAFGIPYMTGAALDATDVRGNDRVNDSTSDTSWIKIGGSYDNDVWSADLSVAYSESNLLGDNLNLAQIQRFGVAYDCIPGEQVCGIDYSDETRARYLDPNQGIVASLNGAFDRRTKDELTEVRADFARRFDGALINRISFGGVASQRDIYSNAQALVVSASALANLVGLQPSTVQPGGYNVAPFTQLVHAGSGSFLGAYHGNMTFPTQWIATDTLALLAAIPRKDLVANGRLLENLNQVVDVSEDIAAVYAQADFESPDGNLTGNFGVRVVHTKQSSAGVAPDLTNLVSLVDAGGTLLVPPAGNIAAKHEYTEILPSLNVKLDLTNDFLLRFGASRTLARPSLTQISPSTTAVGGAGNFSITSGNPELDPFIALNFDFAAEWYPNTDTSLTLAVFHKDLATLVRTVSDQTFIPVTFRTESTNTDEVRLAQFTRNRPENQEGVKLTGFELGYQQFFSFLPGPFENLGVQANYTFIDNSDENVLTAASKNNYNISAFYETDHFGARVSYTWRDKYVTAGLPDGNNGLGERAGTSATLDANLSYNLNDHVSFILEGVNLLEDTEETRSILGDLPFDFFDTGRRLMIGARVRY
ncbi:MAG: TonB-dependent receptor [Alphaproteobacteria bacterium]|nr:TonB-dependent receptor [Alphaproteobacteria bacterium]